MSEQRKGDWVQTSTGRAFWPCDPRADDVDIIDIARALSRIPRFNGHSPRPYYVAEHCFHTSLVVPPQDALWALLHDAAEAYVGDMVAPIKRSLPLYREIEQGVMDAICDRFELSREMPASVREADLRMLATEMHQLFPARPRSWGLEDVEPFDLELFGLSSDGTEYLFKRRWAEITGEDLPL